MESIFEEEIFEEPEAQIALFAADEGSRKSSKPEGENPPEEL